MSLLSDLLGWSSSTDPAAKYDADGTLLTSPRPMTRPDNLVTNPTTDTSSGWLDSIGGLQGLQLGIGGLSALGNLYFGSQQLGLAQDQFNFQKQAYNTNLANQTKAYNSALTDRISTRAKTNGLSDAEVNKYLSKYSM